MQESVAATHPNQIPGKNEWAGHPIGLYVCFATELWERFSFYGMKFLLLLYLTKYHLFTDSVDAARAQENGNPVSCNNIWLVGWAASSCDTLVVQRYFFNSDFVEDCK